jgi:hypothetical protein
MARCFEDRHDDTQDPKELRLVGDAHIDAAVSCKDRASGSFMSA